MLDALGVRPLLQQRGRAPPRSRSSSRRQRRRSRAGRRNSEVPVPSLRRRRSAVVLRFNSAAAGVLPPPHRSIFDGDGKVDTVVYRPSDGDLLTNRAGRRPARRTACTGGPAPIFRSPAIMTATVRADIAAFRPANGTCNIIRSSTGDTYGAEWGTHTDVPVPRPDDDGDGKDEIAVLQPGRAGDVVPGTGRRSERPACAGAIPNGPAGGSRLTTAMARPTSPSTVPRRASVPPELTHRDDEPPCNRALPHRRLRFRPNYDGELAGPTSRWAAASTGTWYAIRSSTGASDAVEWGTSSRPAGSRPTDDGDGRAEIAVYRRSNGKPARLIRPSTGAT